SETKKFPNRQAAQAQLEQWRQEGVQTNIYEWGNQVHVYKYWTEDAIVVPGGTTVWRPRGNQIHGIHPIDDRERKRLERSWLFTPSTRKYLRRRAWRYFRKLGKFHPERYVPAVSAALKLYEDEDVATGLALIDNWGLMHILFHHSPAVKSERPGW